MKQFQVIALSFLFFLSTAAYGQSAFDPEPDLMGNKSNPYNKPRHQEIHKATLDDLFPRSNSFATPSEVFLPPINPIELRVSGIGEAAHIILAENYFVAVNEPKTLDFIDIYKRNKLEGQPNFVTVDCILHPFLAHRNTIKAAVIKKYCMPKLYFMLTGMIAASVTDYHEADDEAVKDDIQRNLAYLNVAIKLLYPATKLQEFGGAQELVDQELNNVKKEAVSPSAIFKRYENFALYHPLGWYDSSVGLRNYYRCRQWLGKMFFALTDVTNNTKGGSGNEFRRAVLLYRSLARAKVGNTTGIDTWGKLQKVFCILEDREPTAITGELLPTNFASAFPADNNNTLKVTLHSVSDPLTRTKLLLSLRSNERRELNSTSIFTLTSKDKRDEKALSFRLFPALNPAEFDWLTAQVIREKDATEGFSGMPVNLLFLHARGFRLADNILGDNTWRLNDDLISSVPILDSIISVDSKLQSQQSIWNLLNNYPKIFPPGAQGVVRSLNWATSCLEGTIAGWVDNMIAIEPTPVAKTDADPNSSDDEATSKPTTPVPAPSPTAASTPRAATFDYLEPATAVFVNMSSSMHFLEDSLTQLGIFPPSMKERTDDFIRLTNRFVEISKQELTGQHLSSTDAQLLSNIDTVLEKISSPVAGNIFINYGHPSQPTSNKVPTIKRSADADDDDAPTLSRYKGVTLGLGGPSTAYLIFRRQRGQIICRGAVYSFYEDPGDPVTLPHWQRKIEYSTLRPPFWCEPFQVVDQAKH